MNIAQLIKIFKSKKFNLLRRISKLGYKTLTIEHLIRIKKGLTEELKKDSKEFQSYIPKRKEMEAGEQQGLAARAYRKLKEIESKQKDLSKVQLAILKYNVTSSNNINIQELSRLTRLKELFEASNKKRKYNYSVFFKLLNLDKLLSSINTKIKKVEEKLMTINEKHIKIWGLSEHSVQAAMPF